jgi:hypothetical protein
MFLIHEDTLYCILLELRLVDTDIPLLEVPVHLRLYIRLLGYNTMCSYYREDQHR